MLHFRKLYNYSAQKQQCCTSFINKLKSTIVITSFSNNNNKRYFSKSSDIETLLFADSLKNQKPTNNNNNKIESIIKKYPNKIDFENYLKISKPKGNELYNFMILSRFATPSNTNNTTTDNNNEYFNIFYKYLEEFENEIIKDSQESFEFLLEFNSKSYRKFDKLFSILFNSNKNSNNDNIIITSNQYSYFLDSIIQIQNKLNNTTTTTTIDSNKLKIINNLIIDIVEKYLNLLKSTTNEEDGIPIELNINHYNKILEIYCNIIETTTTTADLNSIKLIQSTLESIYLSFIKPDMNTYMIVFPYIPTTDSNLLLSKIKNSSGFKSGPNTYQLLSEQFNKLL